jgi:hypothetical protein
MRKDKSRQVVRLGSVILASAIVAGGTVGYINVGSSNKQKAEFKAAMAAKDAELKRYQLTSRKGFVLTRSLDPGEKIQDADITLVDLPETSPADIVDTKEGLVGKFIKIGAKKDTQLTSSIVFEGKHLPDSARRVEVDFVSLPTRIEKTDYLDVQIVFPNGEMYKVLTKKTMEDLDKSAVMMFMDLDTEEQMLLDSALVDAYLNKAELRARQYIEPGVQKEPLVTYYPNNDVLRVMKSDPDILETARYQMAAEIRASLDARLRAAHAESGTRVGADLPDGSAVAKQKATIGATVSGNTANPATPAEGQDSGEPAGYEAPPEDPVDVGGN